MTHRQRTIISQFVTITLFCLCAVTAYAQGTTAFTYQGRLNDAGQPANGAFDLLFTPYDANAAGNQIGASVVVEDVAVTNGVFTVQLDFGAAAFNGAARHLEIGVRPGTDTGSFTTLTPRSPFTPTPYAIRSQNAASADNATQLNGVAAGQYVQTNDPRLTDDRNPTAGSPNYIQNGATQQTGNFNISGDGTAGGTLSGNIVNSVTQFNLNGTRILSNPGTNNLFAGVSAGNGDTTGSGNAFFGRLAGSANTTGSGNAFVGSFAGRDNTMGFGNAFFGSSTGLRNTTGSSNVFFGETAGSANTSGGNNAFVGARAGQLNTSGVNNAFVGASAGIFNTTGGNNAFVGTGAGQANTTGSNNTLLGSGANSGANNLEFATALGAGAVVATSNTIVLGRSADTVNIPGLFSSSFLSNPGTSNTLLGSGANVSSGNLSFATAIGAGAAVTASNTIVLGRLNGSDRVIFPGPITASSINTSGTITTSGGVTAAGLISAIGGLTATGPIRANGGLTVNGLTVSGHLTAGSFGTSGLISTLGGVSLQGGLVLNDSEIRLRAGDDLNHTIGFDPEIDGVRFTAFDQFRWVRGNGSIQQMILRGDGVLSTRGGFNGKCVDLFAGNGFCNQDLAETFRSKEQTEPGDVVTIIPRDHERPTVRRSLRAYDEHLVGVVSTNPGLIFDEGETKLAGANDNFITREKAPVAAVGRVPVKFTLENGAINVGDPLTSSATEPGHAMKATGAGKIIGIALESSETARDGKLLVWLQVGHYAPPQQRDELNALKAANAELTARYAALAARLTQLEQQAPTSTLNHSRQPLRGKR